MTGYEIDLGYGYRQWQPDDSQAALDALIAVDGTGVADESDLPEDGLVDLDDHPDVQQAVRDEYDRLTSDTTDGGTSG